MNDIRVQIGKGNERFLMCVRGIALDNGRVLLFNVIGWDWWALPGGGVEIQETSKDALRREMQEEISTDVSVSRLVWVVENFFKENNWSYHEIGMYYLMDLPREANIINSVEYISKDGPVALRFRWFPQSELEDVNLRPTFLRRALKQIPTQTEHVVWHDN
jgi:ADP-ribose pyrophosphatase YjhB (NUDIX family)